MGPKKGRGQLICYNWRGPGHYARDCTNLTRMCCLYCYQFDHEAVNCPTLIAQMHEKGVLHPTLTQNVQMMRSKLHEEDPNVNMVLRSGVTIEEDKGKQLEEDTWVRKASMKEPKCDLECTRETFLEAKKSFMKSSTSGSKDQPESEMDPFMLTTFLETCMKLLHENKAVKGLQELITRCVGSGEPCAVRKLRKDALHTGSEMLLAVQIGKYELDRVILDLGSDANVLPK